IAYHTNYYYTKGFMGTKLNYNNICILFLLLLKGLLPLDILALLRIHAQMNPIEWKCYNVRVASTTICNTAIWLIKSKRTGDISIPWGRDCCIVDTKKKFQNTFKEQLMLLKCGKLIIVAGHVWLRLYLIVKSLHSPGKKNSIQILVAHNFQQESDIFGFSYGF
ncbi:hypothetical protein ACJX0J_034774, partial [Zea mays]